MFQSFGECSGMGLFFFTNKRSSSNINRALCYLVFHKVPKKFFMYHPSDVFSEMFLFRCSNYQLLYHVKRTFKINVPIMSLFLHAQIALLQTVMCFVCAYSCSVAMFTFYKRL